MHSVVALRSHAEMDYGEGIVMWQAAHVTDWSAAYHPVEIYPHIVFHYTPLYHLAAHSMARLTGDLLAAGRLVSILSLAFICLMFALLAWYCLPRSSRLIGAMSAGLLIFTVRVWDWGCLMRVDTFALLFSFAGMALFIVSRRRPWLVYGAALLFVAAVYTKQTTIAAPLACFILMAIERPLRAVGALLLAVAAGLGCLFLLQSATHGLFLRNIVSYNRNPYIPSQLMGEWLAHLSQAMTLMAAAVALPVLFLLRRRSLRIRMLLARSLFTRSCTVVTLTLLFAIGISTMVGKAGANYNYFLEVDLAAALGAGLFLGWLFQDRGIRSARAYRLCAQFVVLLFALHCVRNVQSLYNAFHELLKPPPDYAGQVAEVLRIQPGPVYSEDMTLLMRAGKEIPAEPAIITCLTQTGQWDESSFLARFANKSFSSVVVYSDLGTRDRFSPGVAAAIRDNYAVGQTIGKYKIYLPMSH